MRRTIEIILVVLGFTAVVAWLRDPNNPYWEPLATFLGTTSFLSLLDLFWPRGTEAERDEIRKCRDHEFRTALDRINHEWNHLEGMSQYPAKYAGKSYAEDIALELVEQDIGTLVKYWCLGRTVKKAIAEVKRNAALPTGKKDVRLLVELLTVIRTKLQKHLAK